MGKRELSLELISSTVLRFPLFANVQQKQPSFVTELALVHSLLCCLPGDLVAEEGQLQQEVVFVINGRLIMTNEEDCYLAPLEQVTGEVYKQISHDSVGNCPTETELCTG